MTIEYKLSHTQTEIDIETQVATVTTLTDLSERFNRRLQQTEFLYKLCDNDMGKLIRLESKIQSLHRLTCPGNREAVEFILNS